MIYMDMLLRLAWVRHNSYISCLAMLRSTTASGRGGRSVHHAPPFTWRPCPAVHMRARASSTRPSAFHAAPGRRRCMRPLHARARDMHALYGRAIKQRTLYSACRRAATAHAESRDAWRTTDASFLHLHGSGGLPSLAAPSNHLVFIPKPVAHTLNTERSRMMARVPHTQSVPPPPSRAGGAPCAACRAAA